MNRPLVVKLGGELLETAEGRARIAAALSAITRPLVVVHGGGRAVDAACDRQGIRPQKVDGLRVTDDATLDVVVSVLGGLANTQLVAALVAVGVPAVGLSGVDAGFGRADRVAPQPTRSGSLVDLGHVGDPVQPDTTLVRVLLENGFVPVVASLGVSEHAQVLNVNADVMACRLAAGLPLADLVIVGATAGVLDLAGRTIDSLDLDGIDAILADGTATAGMVAKLRACRAALTGGVSGIRLVDGRTIGATQALDGAPGTRLGAEPHPSARFA
ncbi:MAG TPA: acetylglutamate kinase [Vicinamibacterales bacterium]|nr:acetylglutamate kinase [Vicinamibacterales bacterium]